MSKEHKPVFNKNIKPRSHIDPDNFINTIADVAHLTPQNQTGSSTDKSKKQIKENASNELSDIDINSILENNDSICSGENFVTRSVRIEESLDKMISAYALLTKRTKSSAIRLLLNRATMSDEFTEVIRKNSKN